MTIAVARSHSTTGRVARKATVVCWHCGQVMRPSASIRQPAWMARARLSASPSADGSACHEMQEPISHHMIGIRSSSPITARIGGAAGVRPFAPPVGRSCLAARESRTGRGLLVARGSVTGRGWTSCELLAPRGSLTGRGWTSCELLAPRGSLTGRGSPAAA